MMIRNLKVICLAFGALLAMGAIVAASASAKYHSEVPTTYLHGTSTTNHVFNTNAGTVTCKTATFTGEQTGTLVSNVPPIYTSATIRVHPVYNSCTAFGFNANVTTTGCDYEFATPVELKAATNVICEAGKQIQIVAFGFCTMNVGTQSPAGSVTYTNEGAGSTRVVKAVSNVTGITYGGNCGTGSNGKYEGTTTIKGFSDSAFTTQVGIWVTP